MADHRLRPRALVAIGIVVAVLLAAAAAGLSYTGIFGARRLVVRGEHHRSEAEVLRAAGLEPGVNVFHLDDTGPRAALLDDPWIAEVRVETSLPSTVIVHVVERRPVAAAGAEALAADGTVLPGAAVRGLPRIRTEGVATGLRAAAAAVVAALHPPQRRALEEVVVANDGAITLALDGLLVRWGAAGEEAAKASALAEVLRAADGVTFATIDVSVPGAPAAVAA